MARRAAALSDITPATALEHAADSGCQTLCIGYSPYRIGFIPIMAPFPDVAMHVMPPPDIVEVDTYSIGSLCSGAEHIAPEYLVVISLKNAAGQTSGEQHPQFFALHKMFCGDSATTDHGLRDLAHRIPNQDAVDLAHRAGPIVSCTDEEGVGEIETIGLSGVEGAVKEVFDGPRHIPKIFRCAKQYTVTGEEIF